MSLNDDAQQLAHIPLFAVLNEEALRFLAFSSEKSTLPAGKILFDKGATASGAYALLQGRMVIYQSDRFILTDPADFIAEPGDLLSASHLLIEGPHDASAVSLDNCTIATIHRTLFLRVMQEFPESAIALRKLLSQKLDRLMSDLDRFCVASPTKSQTSPQISSHSQGEA